MSPQKKKQRLQQLLDNLDNGNDVSARNMKIILNDAEYDDYKTKLEMRQIFDAAEKPKIIKIYEEKLRNAIFADSKLDQYSQRRSPKEVAMKNLRRQVDKTFDSCLEYLNEMLGTDKSLYCWLDISAKYDFSNSPNSVACLPRVITSRSLSNSKRNSGKTKIRDVKILVLTDALDSIENPLSRYDEMPENKEAIDKFKKPKKIIPDTTDWEF